MSFKDLDFAINNEKCDWITNDISLLDRSWDVTSKMTISVFAVLIALTPTDHRYLAKNVIVGMVEIFRKLTDYGHDKDLDALVQETVRVDLAGQELGKYLDHFGLVVVSELLAKIPFKWKCHMSKFDQFIKKCGQFNEFNLSVSEVLEEQSRITPILYNMCSNLYSDSSVESKEVSLASNWVLSACDYVDSLPCSMNEAEMLSKVINKFGFPDVCIL